MERRILSFFVLSLAIIKQAYTEEYIVDKKTGSITKTIGEFKVHTLSECVLKCEADKDCVIPAVRSKADDKEMTCLFKVYENLATGTGTTNTTDDNLEQDHTIVLKKSYEPPRQLQEKDVYTPWSSFTQCQSMFCENNNKCLKMVGEWYINDNDDMYTITELGAVTQRETGFTQTLQASDDDKNFPSSQGWLMVKGLHIAEAWDYFRIEADGRLTLHTFRKDRNKVYNGLPNYCCKSIGIKKAIIPVGMVGKWNIHYTNGIKPIYEIRKDGSIKNIHKFGQDTFFQRSNNQNIFPSLHGWFGAKGLFGSTFDYIRLKSDGTLEIHHFSETSPNIFNGLNEYCCSGKGVKID